MKINFLVSTEQLRIEYAFIQCSKLIEKLDSIKRIYCGKELTFKATTYDLKKVISRQWSAFRFHRDFYFHHWDGRKHMNASHRRHCICRKSINALTFIAAAVSQHIIFFLLMNASMLMIIWTLDPISTSRIQHSNLIGEKFLFEKKIHNLIWCFYLCF